MKKENLAISDLQVGMFIELPGSWLSHNFSKNRFKIQSQEELGKIQKQSFSEVVVDYSKSDLIFQGNAANLELTIQSREDSSDPRFQQVPDDWQTDKFLTDELRNILEDRKLDSDVKAKAVYEHSLDMMDQLLEKPNKENLRSSKQAIFAISDMVLAEPDTASGLLKITDHDYYTYTHSVNVGVMSILLSKEIFKHSDKHNLHELAAGFFLHDIGKVDIDPAVLNKPARLTDDEMAHMREHPSKGLDLLNAMDELTEEAKIIVMQHHEAADGNGYPKRLRNSEIHAYGKICAIPDVFDALTTERSYKHAMTTFDALEFMKGRMITRFDQQFFNGFIRIFS